MRRRTFPAIVNAKLIKVKTVETRTREMFKAKSAKENKKTHKKMLIITNIRRNFSSDKP